MQRVKRFLVQPEVRKPAFHQQLQTAAASSLKLREGLKMTKGDNFNKI